MLHVLTADVLNRNGLSEKVLRVGMVDAVFEHVSNEMLDKMAQN